MPEEVLNTEVVEIAEETNQEEVIAEPTEVVSE